MLDQLFSSIKGEVISSITDKAGINAEQAEQILPIAKEKIEDGFKSEVSSGNISGLMDLFQGNDLAQNGIFNSIKQNLLNGIVSKLGLPESVASIVSSVGLEKIFSLISDNSKDKDGNIDQNQLLSTLGIEGGIGDIAKNMLKGKLGGLGNLFGK